MNVEGQGRDEVVWVVVGFGRSEGFGVGSG